jgi:glycosyltransferase involved in cell wall biosynthesis
VIPSRWPSLINDSSCDLVHLHWVCGAMISVEDIGRINKPVVWTMHDMWAFCGSENIALDDRYVEGYRSSNRPRHETGPDINAWTWQRKRRWWAAGMQVVAPSRWMAECVRKSQLMKHWPVEIVANPIDTKTWSPMPKAEARATLGINVSECVLCVAGIDGPVSRHKGYDLFVEALEILAKTLSVTVLVIGHASSWNPEVQGVTFRYAGLVTDDAVLRQMYAASDVMVVPSRRDNLPNTAVEAACCGLPVVAFSVGGMPDIVDHGISGYLARPFDVGDLADGIAWTIQTDINGRLGLAARSLAMERFDMLRIGQRYRQVYEAVLAK